MSDQRRYFEERPLDSADDGAFYEPVLAEIVTLLEERSKGGARGATVIGLMGSRGSGKTSLMSLLAPRAEKDLGAVYPSHPRRGPNNSPAPRLLELERLDAQGTLIPQLLEVLEGVSSGAQGAAGLPAEAKAARERLWRGTIERFEADEFMKFDNDSASSRDDLTRRLTEVYQRQVANAAALSGYMGDFVRAVTGAGERKQPGPLMLMIDDLDLEPSRTLELFDLLHRLLDHPGLVVVIAADEGTVVRALTQQLESSKRGDAALARALLEKRVPYRWPMPVWTPLQSFGFLWPDHEGPAARRERVERVLPKLWADVDLALVFNATKDPDRAVEDQQDLPPSARDLAFKLLGVTLPETPRGLKLYHNELTRLACGTSEDPWLREWSRHNGLDDRLGVPLLTLLLAYEVNYPEVGLLSQLRVHPTFMSFRPLQSEILGLTPSEEEMAADYANSGFFLGDVRIAPLKDSAMARARYHHLIRLLHRMRKHSPRSALPRFLAVSVMANAWTSAYLLAQAHGADLAGEELWHLKVVGENFRRPDAGEFANLVAALEPRLRQMETYRGDGMIVLGKAPLTLMAWLGWRLRYVPVRELLNDFRGTITVFSPPTGDLRPSRAPLIELEVHPGEAPPEPAGADAVVFIDLIQKGGTTQLSSFPEALRARARASALVLPPREGGFTPELLLPCIKDVLEHLLALREDGVTTVHLGMAAPDVFAFALGRHLHAQGGIQLYEYNPNTQRYEHTLDLDDTPAAEGGSPPSPTDPAPAEELRLRRDVESE